MKRFQRTAWLMACVCSLSILATPALADRDKYHHDRYKGHKQKHDKRHGYQQDFAKVTRAEPIYHTIKHEIPERSCWMETRYEAVDGHQSYTPVVLGTLIGGALGNELGHNTSNKKVGAVVGGALGATLARDWSHASRGKHSTSRPVSEEVCETQYRTEYEERIVGYNVTYRYQGQVYHTRTDEHPGKRLPVAVQVTPIHRR